MDKIYLAGGFYADNWQEKVKPEIWKKNGKITVFDPKQVERGITGDKPRGVFVDPKVYTFWDLNAIKNSDIVFAYIDKDNSAIGVITEIGYAKGLGKTVVAVIEKREDNEYCKDRYFDFVRYTADVCFDNLQDGVTFLKTLI